MAAPFIIPDFIKQARLAALAAGIPCGADAPAAAALLLAATAYNSIPQVNKAEMLRQDLAKTQYELEGVSSALLAERKYTEQLKAQLNFVPHANGVAKQLSDVMKENHQLRERLAELLPPGADVTGLPPLGSKKMSDLKATALSLRKELTARPKYTNKFLEQRWKYTRGLARGYRTHLQKVKDELDNPCLSSQAKLEAITQHVNAGLEACPNPEEVV